MHIQQSYKQQASNKQTSKPTKTTKRRTTNKHTHTHTRTNKRSNNTPTHLVGHVHVCACVSTFVSPTVCFRLPFSCRICLFKGANGVQPRNNTVTNWYSAREVSLFEKYGPTSPLARPFVYRDLIWDPKIEDGKHKSNYVFPKRTTNQTTRKQQASTKQALNNQKASNKQVTSKQQAIKHQLSNNQTVTTTSNQRYSK